MKSKIYYTKPTITNKEKEAVADAICNGWGEKCYAYIAKFEEAFKHYLGMPFAIATSSCTGALHMGLAGLGIGPQDEVILADTNWIATAAPIVHLGAKPIFVDILPDTWCLDPKKVEAAITPKTTAIIAVHLYGNSCEMDELLKLGNKYHIPIIEDSAEALGSKYHGSPLGSLGLFGTFSFHGTKTITTGEGGMFVTRDADLYQRILTLSNHGRDSKQKKQFFPDMVGYKYKLSNLQAALGCAQMDRIEEITLRKREILAYYKKNLGHLSGIHLNPEPKGVINGAWMPTIVFDKTLGITRETLQTAFHQENIDARVFFYPLSSLPMFGAIESNENAWDIPKRAINLPSYHDITIEELNRVIHVILNIVNNTNLKTTSTHCVLANLS